MNTSELCYIFLLSLSPSIIKMALTSGSEEKVYSQKCNVRKSIQPQNHIGIVFLAGNLKQAYRSYQISDAKEVLAIFLLRKGMIPSHSLK